jgi:hypothetical protein
MLAQHGEEAHEGLILLEVALDVEPGHLPAHGDIDLPHGLHVVFGVAGNDARLASDAAVEVDHHTPPVDHVIVDRVEVALPIPPGRQGHVYRRLVAQGLPVFVEGKALGEPSAVLVGVAVGICQNHRAFGLLDED